MPVLSKDALAPFAGLASGSPSDNVLVEHHLALEAKEHGVIHGIFPLMVGQTRSDPQRGEHHVDFFKAGGVPAAPEVVVRRASAVVTGYLERKLKAKPCYASVTVKRIFDMILTYQGHIMQGADDAAEDLAVSEIAAAATAALGRRSSASSAPAQRWPMLWSRAPRALVRQLHVTPTESPEPAEKTDEASQKHV